MSCGIAAQLEYLLTFARCNCNAYLDTVDALMVVLVVHGIVWRQKNPFIVND